MLLVLLVLVVAVVVTMAMKANGDAQTYTSNGAKQCSTFFPAN